MAASCHAEYIACRKGGIDLPDLEKGFSSTGGKIRPWTLPILRPALEKTRAVVLVSKFGHGLVDLLYRCRIGSIPLEVPLIVSNHRDYEDVAVAQNIPFVHLSMTRENKVEQETRLAAPWKRILGIQSSCWRATCRSYRTFCRGPQL